MSARSTYFVTCAPGVEPTLHREMSELRLGKVERQVGGVRFEGTLVDAWRANLWLRTAVRVLMRLDRFHAETSDQLYAGVQAVDWSRHVAPEGSLSVSAQTKDSVLNHSRFVEQRVKDAIVDSLREKHGTRPSVDRDDPDLFVHLHLFKDRATLAVDTSGASLHKRGWRANQGHAPLAETLAATAVLESGWNRRAPLVDPFCGSGTILVEAALLATNRAPGLFRTFAFERAPGHDAARFAAFKDEARAAALPARKLRLYGSDWERERIAGARENLASAGVADWVELDVADARDFAPRRGWNACIVTNPPYGERVGDVRVLRKTFAAFGARLRENCAGYRFAILCGNPELGGALDIPVEDRIELRNGALEIELWRGTLA